MKLQGKVAFVTGAAHGQGASHARHLTREGARFVALDICRDISPIYPLGTTEELEATVTRVKEIDSEPIAIEADVRSSSQMRGAVDRAVERLGTIDILCADAGVCIDRIEGHLSL